MKIGNIIKDKRYSVNLEWCGYPEQRHVVRFCGDYIGNTTEWTKAWILCIIHDDNETTKILD